MNRMKRLLCLVCCFCWLSVIVYGSKKISTFYLAELKCENLIVPLGIDNVTPHFSWKLKGDGWKDGQTYYEIQVASDSILLTQDRADLWNTGKLKSNASVMVPYQGKALTSRSLCYWRVRVWDAKKQASSWSPVARFGVGILDQSQMQGEYIGASVEGGKICASILRKKVKLTQGETSFLHVNTLGYHEIYINGRKVGEDVLTPAVSHLSKRSLIVTYDITPYLREGDNDLLIWLGQGWYKTTTFGAAYEGPLVKAELDVLRNGKWEVVTKTDGSWYGRESGYSDIGTWRALQFGGERVDGRILPQDLSTQALDKMKWTPVVKVNVPDHIASPQMCEINKIHQILQAVSVKKLGEGLWLVDMGKVQTGWFEMQMPILPAGHEVIMEYSDNLTKDGEFDKQGESDIYISGGKQGEYFRNKFNHHAFRYVRISNLPQKPETGAMKSLQIYGDYKQTATFECSDADLNAIHQMIQYTMKCLTFSGYMVDCPHLERAGYGGDGNSSTMSLQTMYDVAPTFENWVQTWGDSMREGGSLPHVGPNPGAGGGGPYWCGFFVQAPQRVELRERIITAATEAFTSKGIKSITMDDIAAALGISKRTLYEVFSDKESLLKECILKAQADRDKYLQKIFEQSHNVLEVILAVFQKSIEVFHQTNKRFFEDIKKYPKVYEMMKNRQDSDSQKTMSFFKTGVEQGIFRPDVNFAIVNLLVREQFDVLLNTDICNEYPFIEVYESIMFTYIRGISTEKGAKVLEDFIQEYRKNRIAD